MRSLNLLLPNKWSLARFGADSRPALPIVMAVCILLSVISAATTVQAQVGASCCRCGKGFILSEEGFGFARDYIGLCGECKHEVGDLEEAVKRIEGRGRGLGESAKEIRKDFNEAVKARDGARDRIYGFSGSAAKFFNALLGMALLPKGSSRALYWTQAGISLSQQPGNWKTWANTGRKLWFSAFGELVWTASDYAIEMSLVRDIARQSMDFDTFAKSCRGGYEEYFSTSRKLGKRIGIAMTLFSYGMASHNLSKDISDYFLAKKEAEGFQDLLNDIDEQIEQAIKEKACIQAEIENQRRRQSKDEESKANEGASLQPRPFVVAFANHVNYTNELGTQSPINSQRHLVAFGRSNQWENHNLKLGPARESEVGSQPNEAKLRGVLSQAEKLNTLLQKIDTRIFNDILPLIMPLWVDGWAETDAKLIEALMKGALPSVKALDADLNRSLEIGRTILNGIDKAGDNTELFIFKSGIDVTFSEGLPKPKFRTIVAANSNPAAVIAKQTGNTMETFHLPPGDYDIYCYSNTRNLDILRPAKSVSLQKDNIESIKITSGIRLNVASWVSKRNSNYGWWGVVNVGEAPEEDKLIDWSKTADALLLPAGHYDVYWKQGFYNKPILLASDITVGSEQITEIGAHSGIRLNIASWVPKRNSNYGWWGVVNVGDAPEKDNIIDWTKSADALLLPVGQYDVYWKQDFNNKPYRLASDVKVSQGSLGVVKVDCGVRLKLPADTPKLDVNYGWWGLVPSGGSPSERVQWSRDKSQPLLIMPGIYDIFWKQNFQREPKRIKQGVTVRKSELVEVIVRP